MRLWLLSVLVLVFLFCTVRIHAQTAQVSPVSNLQGGNAQVVNDNFQYLQSGVNGLLNTLNNYFPGGIVQTSNGGTGTKLSAVATGDTLVMAANGTVTLAYPSPWVPHNIQGFTTTGTWYLPTGITQAYVKVIGAGGNGGEGVGTVGAGGGGAGGYAEGVIAVTGNVSVTIGSTNSFAGTTTIQATAGSNGHNSSGPTVGQGGAGGTGSGGTINLSGSSGGAGIGVVGGYGGSSVLGGIAIGGLTGVIGQAGITCGGGAGGTGASLSEDASGDPGCVIVYY